MIKDYMAIFNLGENENDIRSLTTNRPIASIPFASRYRVQKCWNFYSIQFQIAGRPYWDRKAMGPESKK